MKIFTNTRVIILLLVLLLSIVAINPHPWNEGAAIRSVAKASAAELAGVPAPLAKTSPVSRERIVAVNNQPIANADAYYQAVNTISALGPNMTFTVKTNKNLYSITTKAAYENITLDETEKVTVTEEVFDETTNMTKNVTKSVTRNKIEQRLVGVQDVGLTVYDAPKTNIRQGLDLTGGSRVILKPAEQVSQQDLDLIIANIKERLNVFGLSDIVVRQAQDLEGAQFIIVEIAGANKDEVRELLSNQGKFEARVGNDTVFKGGDKDITYVCRTAECSGIDPRVGCGLASDGSTVCRFRFSISLSPAAAQRQADATSKLNVVFGQGGSYLSQPLELYLDDAFVDRLQISSDLKGKAVTDIEISGSGSGRTQQEATQDTLANMKKLQTVLITGSLPVKLEIVKTDAISPALGQEFVRNAVLVGLLAMFAVVVVVFLRYHQLKISLPIIITMVSEAVIILGFAALVGWNLDLAAIAAIIIAIGTGVDHQIVIADETLHGTSEEGVARTWKERLGRAFFIIMAAYAVTLAAMVPLFFAGAGMLRGFALTTIVGVSVGVFITRPAYAALIEQFLKKDEE